MPITLPCSCICTCTCLGFWESREQEAESEGELEVGVRSETEAESESDYNPWIEAAHCIILIAVYFGHYQLILLVDFNPLGIFLMSCFTAAMLNGLAYWRGF